MPHERVVGSTRNDLRTEQRDVFCRKHAAQRTGREHVSVHFQNVVQRNRGCAECVFRLLHPGCVDVGHRKPRAFRMKLFAQCPAHRAKPLHGHMHAVERGNATVLQRGLDPQKHAMGGHGRRVAAAANGGARHIGGAFAEKVRISNREAHILAGKILTVECYQHFRIGFEKGRRLVGFGIGDNQRLAAAEIHPRHG